VKVKVLAFARYSELLGFAEAELPLPDLPILSELLNLPNFAMLPNDALLAINRKFVGRNEPIAPDDEIALMPPVSGG
jgi:molybdopterin converting factor small subunit